MAEITIQPQQKSQLLRLNWSALPRGAFTYVIPEAIGATDRTVWGATAEFRMAYDWEPDGDAWVCTWEKEGWLDFDVRAWAEDDHLSVRIRLRNLGETAWPNSSAFSCFSPRGALPLADFDGSRTFLLVDGDWTPITQVERIHSGRPTIQLWYVEGRDRPLGFVESFEATPAFYPAGVLAVQSYDKRHMVAVTADEPLFLFGNLEFSCIHCCPSFGALGPGEQGTATHRVFFCEDTGLEELTPKLEQVWA